MNAQQHHCRLQCCTSSIAVPPQLFYNVHCMRQHFVHTLGMAALTWAQQMRGICLKAAVIEPRASLAAQVLDVVIAVALCDTGVLSRRLQAQKGHFEQG